MKPEFLTRRRSLVHLFFLTAFFTICSCNKTEDYENLNLLIEKNWNLESRKMNGVEVSDSCDLDDILKFDKDFDFSYNVGSSICNQEVLEKNPLSWKLTDNYTIIRMKYKFSGDGSRGSMIEYWEIIELSDTALIVQDATAEGNNLIPEIRTYK